MNEDGAAPAESPASPADTLPSVLEVFDRVRSQVGTIGKDHQNDKLQFKFRSVDDVANAVYDAMCEQHLILQIKEGKLRTEVRIGKRDTNGQESRQTGVFLKIRYTFIGPRGDKLRFVIWGEGADAGAAALNKARAAAFKYLFLHGMQLPTEDLMVDGDAVYVEGAAVQGTSSRRRRGKRANQQGGDAAASASVDADRPGILRAVKAAAKALGYEGPKLTHWLANIYGAAHPQIESFEDLSTVELQAAHGTFKRELDARRPSNGATAPATVARR